MNKKITFGLLLILLMMTPLSVIAISYPEQIDGNSTDRSFLNVSAEESFDIERITEEVKTHPYYKNHDNNTLKWMESFENKKVFTAKEYLVIMDKSDARLLPTQLATDVAIYDEFEANIIENRSLGSGLKDVLYVKNVDFKKQGMIPFYPKANTPTSKVGDENFSNIVPKSINNSKSINTMKIIK